ncbi:BACON domain-containing protein [Paraglaciecola sp. L3A3]|uniref:BACON domain-containing protein n=1 Tax=Paraglaciecola sp. L3A3 TaxID=2686358 RepID=UPI00131EAECE|nr:BACON domain-containing carbohydrate-binding protein [Paraglaciecola sp. L3A3]
MKTHPINHAIHASLAGNKIVSLASLIPHKTIALCCSLLVASQSVSAQELVTSIDFNQAQVVDLITNKNDYDTGLDTSGNIEFSSEIAKDGNGFKVDFLRYLRIPLDVVAASNGKFTVKYDYNHISSNPGGGTAWHAHSFAVRDLSNGYGWSHGFRNLGNDYWTSAITGFSKNGAQIKGVPEQIPDFNSQTWHEYVLVFDNNRLTWYVDGVYAYYQDFNTSFADWSLANSDITIGARFQDNSIQNIDGEDGYLGTGGSNNHLGSVEAVFDNIRIWDAALTTEQIAVGVESLVNGEDILELSQDRFSLQPQNTELTIDIVTNTPWTLSNLPNWLTANITSGAGNASLVLTVAENATNLARSANVMVNDLAISVVQATKTDLLTTDAVIYPDTGNQTVEYVFYDIKSFFNAKMPETTADKLFIEDGFNGVRTNIWGTRDKPDTANGRYAHPEPGVVVESLYAKDVTIIKQAMARNPELIVFASKKLNGKYSFPDWVLDDDGVIPELYVILLADYIEYMASEGIPIDILGLDNERVFNEGNVTPEKFKQVVDLLEILALERGFPMPTIIGHEDYVPGRNNWMKNLADNNWTNRLDIYGTHYYPENRNATMVGRLESDISYASDLPRWHSELHWNAKSDIDDILEIEDGFGSLLDMTDRGFNGLMWWGYGLNGFRGATMGALTTHLLGYTPIVMTDHDGIDIFKDGNLHTRAYRKGNKMVVFVLNINGNSHDDYSFKLNTGEISSEVSFEQWADGNETSISGIATSLADNGFSVDLSSQSMTMLTFDITPQDNLFNESWNTAASTTLNGTNTLVADNEWQFAVDSSQSKVTVNPASSYFEQQVLTAASHADQLDKAEISSTLNQPIDMDLTPSVTFKLKAIFSALSESTDGNTNTSIGLQSADNTSGFQLVLNSDVSQASLQLVITGLDGTRAIDLVPAGEQLVGLPYDVTVTLNKVADNQTNIAYNIYRNRMLWLEGTEFLDTSSTGGQLLDTVQINTSAESNIVLDDIQLLGLNGQVTGDWDNDGDVDVNDMRAMVRAIQQSEEIDMSFDFNNDGTVSILDARGMSAICTRTRCAAE